MSHSYAWEMESRPLLLILGTSQKEWVWTLEHTARISHQSCSGCSEGWNENEFLRWRFSWKSQILLERSFESITYWTLTLWTWRKNISFVVGSLCCVLEEFSSKSSNSCFTVQALKFYPFIGCIRFCFWKLHMLLFTSNILFPKYQLPGRI